MEHIAHVVDKDPFDVRMQNIPRISPIKPILIDFAKSVGNYLSFSNTYTKIDAILRCVQIQLFVTSK
jgi:hypothetical protein